MLPDSNSEPVEQMTTPLNDGSGEVSAHMTRLLATVREPRYFKASMHFCDEWIEIPGDPWAGTNCKLRNGHDGPCSAHYPKEADRAQ